MALSFPNAPVLGEPDQRTLTKILAQLQAGIPVSGVEIAGDVVVSDMAIDQTTPGTTNGVVVNSSALPAGAATQTTSAAILAKLIAAPSTEAKQDAANALLTSLLAKVIAAPATEAKQTTGNSSLSSIDGKVTACNTGAVTVAASALPTGAATQATLSALNDKVTACNTGAVVISSGNITTTPVAVSRKSSTAYEASNIVKASAGTLYSITGYNSGPAQWIQVHDSATLPANGAVPVLSVGVQAASTFDFPFPFGLPCSTGIVISNSSAVPTKVIGSNDCFITALYR